MAGADACEWWAVVSLHGSNFESQSDSSSALASALNQQGASPCPMLGLNIVTERNCVAMRRGGEQREVNDQSVTQVNSIRPVVVASLLGKGEAQMTPRSCGMGAAGRPCFAVSLEPENQTNGPGRQTVAGDRMVGRFDALSKEI